MLERTDFEARLSELTAQAAKLQADFNATNGAIQDCRYWISMLDKQHGPPPLKKRK